MASINVQLLTDTAYHEAGHAVMRWLLGWPCTELMASEGDGYCAGTGRKIRVNDRLLITLAGFAAEAGCMADAVNLSASQTDDFNEARQLLQRCEWLRLRPDVDDEGKPTVHIESVEAALRRHFAQACDVLFPHALFIEEIALRLARERKLSARVVAGMCRSYRRRLSEGG